MNRLIAIVEKTAGCCIGILAVISFCEAILRYGFRTHIPDGFVIGQTMQGIAICWGIATATYADRHITVDLIYSTSGRGVQRVLDTIGYTINVLFLALFAYAINFKVLDIMKDGEISNDLSIPLWSGYLAASLGIVATLVMSVLRWWQVTRGGPTGAKRHG
ncbi:MAG: hypothetical protein A3G25_15080 [Betaproteobacteria bacterium RIFCSPLOWO2_12_FULL_63_13]|nr:MAG: hypothetical protein A3H32_20220 [Betaproteobacteria bacterium RIFCSPLOWO2_02_FULL_63_19]OGA49013.1 MAG: hypothetical protein A3G25_15080 [Betaproteobacteria bacterium RIFCSPLOWO2_12_FULL_63_13]